MFGRSLSKRVFQAGLNFQTASFSTSKRSVAVLGAAGGIGQPLSLLLKDSPQIASLRLFDVVNTPGVAADLSHIDTQSKVSGHVGMENIDEALKGCDVVVVPAGVPRKPGMTRDDLFNTNATIVQSLAKAIGRVCPEAMILIISNPVNSTVPIVAETLSAMNVYNPKRLFGVTTLDVMRANTFVGELENWDPKSAPSVKVVGGHAGTTILPLLSQVNNASKLGDDEVVKKLMHRIQFGGDEVVQAKDGAGSATLSMAAAAARFTDRLMTAMDGSNDKEVVECAFVENDVTSCRFFSTELTLGPSGVEKVHSLGSLSQIEQEAFDSMLPDLQKQIKKGEDFVKNSN